LPHRGAIPNLGDPERGYGLGVEPGADEAAVNIHIEDPVEVDLNEVDAALGDDAEATGLLNAFIDRVDEEQENHQLRGGQARILRQSAIVVIGIIEGGP
jgi:hypothetical protein|tara:strand:+ start:43 stop:339 length:297 start_codon:yes stop_codon:yes gene_type:complete